jgi:hypothetical protein
MSERGHEPALPIGEVQDAVDVRLRQPVEEGRVGAVAVARILQRPSAARLEFEVLVLAIGDTPVDLDEARLKPLLQFRQMHLDGLIQKRQPGVDDELFPVVAPPIVVDEIVFHAPEADAVTAEDVARLDAVAEMPVEEELVAIRQQPAAVTVSLKEVAPHFLRNPAQRNVLLFVGSERPSGGGGFFHEPDRFEQRSLRCRPGERDALQDGANVDFESLRRFVDMLPLERRFVEPRVGGHAVGHGLQPIGGQHREGISAYLLERRIARNAFVREVFKHFAALRHVVVDGRPEGMHEILRSCLCVIRLLSDVMKQALDQVIVQLPVAMLNETEQIHINGRTAHPPELVRRVIIHERGIVPDVFL